MKTALVTGGARRVGAAMVRHLQDAGWRVLLHHHSSTDEAGALQARAPERTFLLQGDLSQHAERNQLSATVQLELAHEPLDLVVHNASRFPHARLEHTDDELVDGLFALHVKAPLFLSRDLAPSLRRSKDALVITMLDAGAELNWPGYLPYSLSKQALEQLTIALARELAPEIRVNGIKPGFILPPEEAPDAYRKAEMRRLSAAQGSPEAILRALDYLLEARFVTGELLHVDGGRRWLRP